MVGGVLSWSNRGMPNGRRAKCRTSGCPAVRRRDPFRMAAAVEPDAEEIVLRGVVGRRGVVEPPAGLIGRRDRLHIESARRDEMRAAVPADLIGVTPAVPLTQPQKVRRVIERASVGRPERRPRRCRVRPSSSARRSGGGIGQHHVGRCSAAGSSAARSSSPGADPLHARQVVVARITGHAGSTSSVRRLRSRRPPSRRN